MTLNSLQTVDIIRDMAATQVNISYTYVNIEQTRVMYPNFVLIDKECYDLNVRRIRLKVLQALDNSYSYS